MKFFTELEKAILNFVNNNDSDNPFTAKGVLGKKE